jgi:hypothetical protein
MQSDALVVQRLPSISASRSDKAEGSGLARSPSGSARSRAGDSVSASIEQRSRASDIGWKKPCAI